MLESPTSSLIPHKDIAFHTPNLGLSSEFTRPIDLSLIRLVQSGDGFHLHSPFLHLRLAKWQRLIVSRCRCTSAPQRGVVDSLATLGQYIG